MNWRPPVTKPLLAFGTPKQQGDRSTFRVTSPFGWRDNPLNPGSQVFHGALDMGDFGSGSEVVAAGDGTVVAVGFLKEPHSLSTTQWASGNYGGWMVVIRHDSITTSNYAHMIPLSSPVRAGQVIKAGNVIGKVGDSGSAQGAPHLHFGIKVNGKDVDPWPLITGEDMKLPDKRIAYAKGTVVANTTDRRINLREGPSTDSPRSELLTQTAVFDIVLPFVEGGAYTLNGVTRTDWALIARAQAHYIARPLLSNITPTPEGASLAPPLPAPADCSAQEAKLVRVREVLTAIESAAAAGKVVTG